MDVIAVVMMVLIITIIGLSVLVLHTKRKLYYAEEHSRRLLKELLDIRSSERQEVSIWE